MYVQDYGAPVGWRLAIRDLRSVVAVISQNGNVYTEGFVDEYWESIWRFAETPNAANEEVLRAAFTLDAIKWQYTHGVPDPSLVSPDTRNHDYSLIRRPGNAEVQLELARDYPSNVELYPALHDYFRTTQVPLLAVWVAMTRSSDLPAQKRSREISQIRRFSTRCGSFCPGERD